MAPTAQPPPGAGTVQAGPAYSPQPFDTTGQIAPAGMKPRVTATLWEDEGSLCFQVEAKGICVARREGEFVRPATVPSGHDRPGFVWDWLTRGAQTII